MRREIVQVIEMLASKMAGLQYELAMSLNVSSAQNNPIF